MSGMMITNLGAIAVLKHRADVIMAKDSNGLQLQDDGGNRGILVADGGFVAIGGSSAPAALLHLQGGASDAILHLTNDDSGNTISDGFQIDFIDTTWGTWIWANEGPILFGITNGGNMWLDNSSRQVWIGYSVGYDTNTNMTAGLVLDQATAADEILALKSSNVAHGVTLWVETDTYMAIRKVTSDGGASTYVIGGTGASAVCHHSLVTQNEYTSGFSSSFHGAFEVDVWKKDGTGGTTLSANSGVVSFLNAGNAVWGLDAEGDTWQSGSVYAAGLQLGGAGSTADIIRDEDNMSSDDPNALATQQSIKAYVDTEVAGAGGVWTVSGDNIYWVDTGQAIIGESGDCADSTIGLTINQLGNDDNIMTFKSSDVAHGMTTLGSMTETDTWGFIRKYAAASGGMRLTGATSDYVGFSIYSFVTNSVATAMTNSCAIVLQASKKSGTTVSNVDAGHAIVSIKNHATSVWALDSSGVSYQSGSLFIGCTSNAGVTLGITVDQGANDDAAIAVKSSDVAHGATHRAETDVWGEIKKAEAAAGGCQIQGYKDADGGPGFAVVLQGHLAENADTTKSSAGRSIVEIKSLQTSGAADANVVADGNVFGVRAYKGGSFSTVYILDEDGDSWQSGVLIVDGGNYAMVKAASGGSASLYLYSDQETANDDKWRMVAIHTDNFQIQTFASGSWLAGLEIETDRGVVMPGLKSGATQAGAGAAAGELWYTVSHASLPDYVVMIGV